MEQKEDHTQLTVLQMGAGIILIALLAFVGWKFRASQPISVDNCDFPASATDLRLAGQKLSDEIEGTVGYSVDGKTLTLESTNGFVLLTPVVDEKDIISTLRSKITEQIGCAGASDLSYWVFDVSDPYQLPPELLTQLGTERPSQILLILGSLYVFSVDSLITDPNSVNTAITRIVTDHGTSPIRSRSNSTFTQPQNPGDSVDFGTSPAPAPLERQPGNSNTSFGTGIGTGSTGSGSGGSSGTGGGRTIYNGGDQTYVPPNNNTSGSGCTLKIVCEDPSTGNQFNPGTNGCQGSDFYGQSPTPPQGTRQVALCVYPNGSSSGGSCPDEYWFYYRNCLAQASNIGIGGSSAVGITPGEYDSIAGTLQANSPGNPGTLFTVPPTYNSSPVNYTVRCSYPDQTAAIQCGMPGSGEYCLPGWNPVGCVAPPPDFGTQ